MLNAVMVAIGFFTFSRITCMSGLVFNFCSHNVVNTIELYAESEVYLVQSEVLLSMLYIG